MWLPAAVFDYRFYFTMDELCVLYECGTRLMSEALLKWLKDPEIELRVYYKPGKYVWKPEPSYHLRDVLRLSESLGIKISKEFESEIIEAREHMPEPANGPRPWKSHLE